MNQQIKTIKAWGRMHKPSKQMTFEWNETGTSIFAIYPSKAEAELEIEASRKVGIDDMLIHVRITYALPKPGKKTKVLSNP